jgi:hypothetical protein
LAKRPTTQHPATLADAGWIPLRKAAELCGTTTDDLKQRIKSGQLRAYTVESGSKRKFRVTRQALIIAGLIGGRDDERTTGTVDLVSLIRDQNQRISALEDQRAQLAGQLGVALERLRSMDLRMTTLEALPNGGRHVAEPATAASRSPVQGLRNSILKAIAVPAGRAWKRERA